MHRAIPLRLVPLALVALAAACSDAPTAPAAQAEDPLVAAVNRQLAGAATVHSVVRTLQGTELDGPSLTLRSAEARAQAEGGAKRSSFDPFPPIYCSSPSDSSWCPEIYIGAAVWGWGVPGKATLYAHLDVMSNAESSELNVSFGAGGGCSGGGGTFGGAYLTGGSSTPYALVVSEVHEFTGGQVRWTVNASGSAMAPWGTFINGWASATKCT